jgi:hypothetical protein
MESNGIINISNGIKYQLLKKKKKKRRKTPLVGCRNGQIIGD